MEALRRSLQKSLKRCAKREEFFLNKYRGKEISLYNFYAGQTLGYWQGKRCALENALDELNELMGDE